MSESWQSGKFHIEGSPISGSPWGSKSIEVSPNESELLGMTSDIVKILELKGIKEEEEYIQRLRNQRDKVEKFRNELQRKDATITQLQSELHELRYLRQDHDQSADIISQLQNQIEKYQEQFHEERAQSNSHIEYLEESLSEVKETFKQAKQAAHQEVQNLNKQRKDLTNKLKESREECDRLKVVNTQQDELIMEIKAQQQERIQTLNEQMAQMKQVERVLKDQVTEIAFEKMKLEERIEELTTLIGEQNFEIDEKRDLMSTIKQEYKKNERSQQKIQDLEEEINKSKDLIKDEALQYEHEFKEMIGEMAKYQDLLGRQENTIVDLRQRRQDDEKRIKEMRELATKFEREADKANALLQEMTEAQGRIREKCRDHEKSLKDVRVENAELRRELKYLVEKYEADKRERDEWARARLNRLHHKTEEVNKLTKMDLVSKIMMAATSADDGEDAR
mmetsp:Transcript_8019/g.8709  ORF Transcript_8019/g.8709 Transcript_8019/m.8709 type:complete len:451 (+) Transcript_8019:44-1396(+)